MDSERIEIGARLERLQGLLASTGVASPVPPEILTEALTLAHDALNIGCAEVAVETLEMLVKAAPAVAPGWKLLGFAYGRLQRIVDARGALARAASLDSHDPSIALGHARANLDTGLAAVALFEHALSAAPGSLSAVGGLATALIAEHRTAEAGALLEQTLRSHPDWLAGHKSLADLRWATGDKDGFARSYEPACSVQPQNLSLRLAWFSALAQTHQWDAALRVVADGEVLIGPRPGFMAARSFIASESGDVSLAEQLFSQCESIRDGALGMAYVRHCLKTMQFEKAHGLALDLVRGPSAPMIWPYLSLIWRVLGDPRAHWLDGSPPYICTYDLNLSSNELHDLATCLRRLHAVSGPYLDQSVRGGTQTEIERQLFFRSEPEIQRVRASVCEVIREYVSQLPPHSPGHPLLGVARERILFSGSWSVRLRSHGFHVSHTHPMGWISSALYVSLPEQKQLGPAPAGWIRFGSPPSVLGLSLPAYAQIEPKPGRLVLFPSTMWHETLPFEDGERLVIAFDVMRASIAGPKLVVQSR